MQNRIRFHLCPQSPQRKRQCHNKGTQTASGPQGSGESLLRQGPGQGNREEATSEWVLTNMDAEKSEAGSIQGEKRQHALDLRSEDA